MPRSISLLTVALLTPVTAVLGSPAGAQAADHNQAFTTQAIVIKVQVGPNNDECIVQADLYTPAGVDKDHPAPAILTSNGFGGSKDDDGQKAGASAFAKAGYVAISYSGLGFGGSNCKIYLDDRDYDGKAGKQIVDVLAGSKAYADKGTTTEKFIDYVDTDGPQDPRVGMIGGSYGGQNQFAIAGQDDRIDAIIPTITWNDLSYSLAPNNTDQAPGTVTYDTPGVAKKEWIDLFFGLGIVSGLQNTTTTADPNPVVGCPNFRTEACPAAAQLNTLGYPDGSTLDLARHASVGGFVGDIRIPTLLVQGQNDTLFNIREAVATYRALKAQGTTVAMSWFSGGHSGDAVAGDLDLTGGVDASHQGRRWINWMDRFVRGDSAASAGPEFEYFRDWVDYAGTAVDPAYASASSFSGAPTSTLFLSGTDRLTLSKGSVDSGSAQFTASAAGTSYSETSGVGENSPAGQPPPSDTPGTFASYTTAKLTRATDLVGSPRLNVRISAPVAAQTQAAGPGGKLVLFTKLYDVAPDGTQTLQYRLISPVRVKDVTKPVQVDLPGVAQRFPAGHKIRLVIAGGDLAYANNSTEQPVTVLTSRQRPGTLTLPLVSSTTGSCPKGTTGKQPFCEKPVATGTTGSGSEGSAGGGDDDPTESGSAGEAGGAVAGAGSGAQASNAFSPDQASSLPDTGSSRGLLAALALGLALLMAGSLLVVGQRVRSQ